MNIIIYITNLDCIFRIFGGLVADIKRKLPWYKSDFTDSLHIQCVASFVYLFLATLTPNVTFGGLLTEATDEYMVCIFFIVPFSCVAVVVIVWLLDIQYLCGSSYHHWSYEFESRSWRGVLDTTICNKVCDWLATGGWFSPCTLVSSTNKTDHHDIAKILLKETLNTISLRTLPFVLVKRSETDVLLLK